MANLPLCVLGSQIGTNAGKQIKAELYNWLKSRFDVITVDADENAKSEYPFIKKVIETAISSNKPVLYIHTKGACNVISKAFDLNKKTGVKIPNGALPHDSQIIVRRMWKHEFTTNYNKYLDAVDGNDPVVACPYAGGDKTTWQNAFVINPSAARILQQSFHEDPNRYYYERMFEHTNIKVLGIRLNNVERDKKCQSNMWQDIWDNFFVPHPFNIISNNCFGGFIYKNLHIQYNNPFIFSMVHFSDIAHIFMDSLNWANIQLEHTKGPHYRNSAFDIVVDNHIRIHYVHYLEDMVHEPPIIQDGNVLGKDIYKYVADKYIERVKRMCSMYIQPYYILSWHPSSGDLSDINALAIKMNEFQQRYCVVVPPDIDIASLHNIQSSNIIVSPYKSSSTWVKDSVNALQNDIISRICATDMF
jgi:hypothetical protein